MSETKTSEPLGGEKRRRGRRPADAGERRQRVEAALAELSSARVPFTMGDLAERAGISRATLYRDAGLRDLVGNIGDGPTARPVSVREHETLRSAAQKLEAERVELKRKLREAEKRAREAEARVSELARESVEEDGGAEARHVRGRGRRTAPKDDEAQTSTADAERIRRDAYADGFAAGARAASPSAGGAGARGRGGANPDLLLLAARLPRPSLLAARKNIARVLHPDLFAKDPATAMIATELLKQINAVVGA